MLWGDKEREGEGEMRKGENGGEQKLLFEMNPMQRESQSPEAQKSLCQMNKNSFTSCSTRPCDSFAGVIAQRTASGNLGHVDCDQELPWCTAC